MIGYKNIPITGMTQKGPMSVIVGLTYLREGDSIQLLDSWINPVMEGILGYTDKVGFVYKAVDKLRKNLTPIEDHHKWEEVLYG